MSRVINNPIYWSTEDIIALGPDNIHQLAKDSAGTLNSYRVVLGRCLLAVHRTKLYESFGGSGSAHYGTSVLGLSAQQARSLRWVAERLEHLPQLSRAGEVGEICWSNLRAVAGKATSETEGFWLEICRKPNKVVAKLASSAPQGGLPGDLPVDGEREPAVTEIRVPLGVFAKTTVDRGLQVLSLKEGRPIPLAEAVESLFAQLLEKEKSSPEELADLAKSQNEARKDLLAQHFREQPDVQEARKLARSMGLMSDVHDADFADTPEDGEISLRDVPLADIYGELTGFIESAIGGVAGGEYDAEDSTRCSARNLVDGMNGSDCDAASPMKCSARNVVDRMNGLESGAADPEKCYARNDGDAADETADRGSHIFAEWSSRNGSSELPDEQPLVEDAAWSAFLEAHQQPCPGNEEVVLLARDWRNKRLRFNPDARHVTEAQRREILRRDGYCCSTPGCPNHLWLEVHHAQYYCYQGKTLEWNLVTLCSRCHKNVHRGHLRIIGVAPDKLLFLDRHGRDLSEVHKMGVAGWLDFWLGWSGTREDSHQHRLADGRLRLAG